MRRRVAAVTLLALAAALSAALLWRTGPRYRPGSDDFPRFGIDISHHQGNVDWRRVAADGVGFAYLKATEGGDWVDPRFAQNRAQARAAGLEVGAYHFFTFCRDARAQAQNFLAAVPAGPMLPPVLDVEFGGNCAAVPGREAVRASVLEWLDLVEQGTGQRPLVYVTEQALAAFFEPADFGPAGRLRTRLWYRRLFVEPPKDYAEHVDVWQYHARGQVDGIAGPVDLNLARAR